MKSFFQKPFFFVFLLIILVELLSLIDYQLLWLNFWSFFVLSLGIIVLAFWRLDYAVFALLAELMVGSKGHFFSLELAGFKISWRMVIFGAVIVAWLIGVIKRKYSASFFRSKFFIFYLLFFIFVLWGIVAGFIYKNENKNIFFDANAWFYFLLIFPIFDVLAKKENLENIFRVVAAAVFWLALKTLIVFFVFTHQVQAFVPELYYWIRTRGLGEVTILDSIYRVFFQSQIYSLIAFFIFLAIIVLNKEKINPVRNSSEALNPTGIILKCNPVAEQRGTISNGVKNYFYLFLPTIPIILSFSRSFWLAFLITLVLFFIFLKIKEKQSWLELGKVFLLVVLVLGLSLFFIWFSLKLPPKAKIDLSSLFQKRITTEEAAASSRLAQLPYLLSANLEKPILGSGFGKTISYFSRDPRALERHPLGLYTTYAFEWGYLDIWLKIGLLGLAVFLIFVFKIFQQGWKIIGNCPAAAVPPQRDPALAVRSRQRREKLEIGNSQRPLVFGLLFGLIALAVTHLTSPYLNHPLGIGYLILCALVFEKRHTITY